MERSPIETRPLFSKMFEKKPTFIGHDITRALLVISGKDVEQLRLAVESFDILSLPFPDSNKMKVHEFDLPEIGLYTGKQMVKPGLAYEFSRLNFETITFRGFSARQETLDFRVPPDFKIKANQYVNVLLNFAYGAGIRIDSVLNIELNGHSVASIHLNDPVGALVSNYKLALPTYLFRGGLNSLSFKPIITPLITENCSFIQAENLFLTIFESSSLTFPEMPHEIEMPRLDLLFVNGFPFTRWPDGYQTLFYLGEFDEHHLSAAYNMVGNISQKNGYPLLGIELTKTIPDIYEGEILMIGALDSLPKEYLDLAPIQFGKLNRVPYPVYQGFDETSTLAFITQESEIGINKGILMQFESPDKPGRSVVMLTAKTGAAIEQMSVALLEPEVQGAVKNDLNLIDFINDSEKALKTGNPWRYVVSTIKAGNTYITGKSGEVSPVRSLLIKDPYLYWALISVVLFLLVITISYLIKRQKNKRNPDGHDDV